MQVMQSLPCFNAVSQGHTRSTLPQSTPPSRDPPLRKAAAWKGFDCFYCLDRYSHLVLRVKSHCVRNLQSALQTYRGAVVIVGHVPCSDWSICYYSISYIILYLTLTTGVLMYSSHVGLPGVSQRRLTTKSIYVASKRLVI
jgi:hypothetical protein